METFVAGIVYVDTCALHMEVIEITDFSEYLDRKNFGSCMTQASDLGL